MSRNDDQVLALLASISDEIARLRNDVSAIQTGLIRIGAIVPKKTESVKLVYTWSPPILQRLGDILTIIAQSNPASAKAFQEAGFDTDRDPAADPEVDPNTDANVADGRNAADGADPKLRDADRNPRNLRPAWLGGDNDPNKKDLAVNPRDVADVADPVRTDTRDDPDGVNQVKPDTPADSITSLT